MECLSLAVDRAIEAFDKAVSQIVSTPITIYSVHNGTNSNTGVDDSQENLESPRRHDQFRKTSILQKKAQCLMRRKRFAGMYH